MTSLSLTIGALAMTMAVAQSKSSTWDGVYTDVQAARGQLEYSAHCEGCHGTDLGGGEVAPGLIGGEFKSSWNSLTLQDLLDRMYKTMPQDAPQSLNRTQDADILAYILKKGGYPPGTGTLTSDPQQLGNTVFLADRP